MDVFEAIGKRHSYRGPFRDQRIPRSDLERIVQAGLQAPSGKNEQTTTFVIVDDADLVRRINEMPSGNKAQRQAKAFIACIVTNVWLGFPFMMCRSRGEHAASSDSCRLRDCLDRRLAPRGEPRGRSRTSAGVA